MISESAMRDKFDDDQTIKSTPPPTTPSEIYLII
jgi:hypothetical protein